MGMILATVTKTFAGLYQFVKAILRLLLLPCNAAWNKPDPRYSFDESMTLKLTSWILDTFPTATLRWFVDSQSEHSTFQYARVFLMLLISSCWYRPVDHVNLESGVQGRWYRRGGQIQELSTDDGVVVLYIHGGGFVCGTSAGESATFFNPLLGALSTRGIATRIFSIDYALAPDNTYPTPVCEVLSAYTWLTEKVQPKRLVVMGDSAGANLVLTLLLGLPDDKTPACAVMISPWVDLHCHDLPSATPYDYMTKDLFVTWRNMYVGHDLTKVEEASPGLHRLEGLPPLMVVYGECELLANAIRTFVRKARDNVDVEEVTHPFLFHGYPVVLEDGGGSIDIIADYVVRRVGVPEQ
ncbi:Aste57867_22490 [Aphanomyces stellatus]|uniref:Aste57867_22490 protein n=1 Tax=Aphanomyces stellatus TaxID=120398 RepID=A0A485LK93_9STRA|nr:hypothetical protein As57867_022420 [Aphanomyces stellatus]VFT99150.1 Aste57867_22490 [Aphanomyces stellatus]